MFCYIIMDLGTEVNNNDERRKECAILMFDVQQREAAFGCGRWQMRLVLRIVLASPVVVGGSLHPALVGSDAEGFSFTSL